MQVLQDAFHRTAGSHLDPAKGARAAVSMLLPLLVLEVLGHNHVGSSAATGTLLGVLFVAFCDLGSTRRERLLAMSAAVVVGTLLLGLGAWIGGPWWVAVPALGLATFLSGLLPVFGKVAAQVGTILTIVFALALGQAGRTTSALLTALGFFFGGVFFVLLVLAILGAERLARSLAHQPAPALPPPPAALAAPRTALPSRTLLLQLALLRALGTAAIAGIAWGANVPYPHWAPVVVIASVRPDQVAAVNLTIQRILGTVLGAGLADVVLNWVASPPVLIVLAVAGMFLAFTVKDVNNTFFIFFLTLLTLLLLNIPAPGPTYVVLRIVATLIGAVAALGVSWLSVLLVQQANRATPPAPGEAAG
jgi:hypothetical protein